MARPIPRPPPVTRAMRFASFAMEVDPVHHVDGIRPGILSGEGRQRHGKSGRNAGRVRFADPSPPPRGGPAPGSVTKSRFVLHRPLTTDHFLLALFSPPPHRFPR